MSTTENNKIETTQEQATEQQVATTNEEENTPEVLYVDAKDDQATVIESLCSNCFKQGETRLLMTEIPFFKSVIIMSFSCPHCGYRNSEIQNGGQLEEFGVEIKLRVTSKDDLQRDIVRGEWASTYIPELELEIPALKKGHMSTLEGFLTSFRDDLRMGQEQRMKQNPDYANQIEEFLRKLDKYIEVDEDILPFTFRLCDPSGNSYVQNPKAPEVDPNLQVIKFNRTKEQLILMGYSPENAEANEQSDPDKAPTEKTEEQKQAEKAALEAKMLEMKKKHEMDFETLQYDMGRVAKYSKSDTDNMIKKMEETNKKVLSAHKMDFTKPLDENEVQSDAMEFDVECDNCGHIGKVRMCTCSIPYFKEIIIMAFTCDHCGKRSTEVKVGGGIPEKATKYTITVTKREDMDRDIFKSETAEIEIPEIGVTVVSGSLGGIYSTVEGLLEKMLSTLRDDNPFVGDSAEVTQKSNFESFLTKLDDMKAGKILPFTLILNDPMSSCFIQNPNHPDPDPIVDIEVYERTFEQNEDLGINDMVV